MNYISEKEISEYYKILGLEAVLPKTIVEAIAVCRKREKRILISDSKLVRGVGKLCNMQRMSKSRCLTDVECHFSMIDALKILSRKHVPVFFYNRVGVKRDGYKYKDSAVERMQRGLNFPKMANDFDKYKDHLYEVIGEECSPLYVNNLKKIPQIIKKGNSYSHEDYQSCLVNVINGKRVTAYTKENSNKRIHLYGRCGVFGYAVPDNQTLASQLQKMLNVYDIEVINHGLWGGEDKYILHNFFTEIAGFNENDIVVFYMKHFDKKLNAIYENLGMHYKEITDEWHRYDEAKWCFYDKPGHMNTIGYHNVAELISSDLLCKEFMTKKVPSEYIEKLDAKYLNGYLKEHKNNDFEQEVEKYVQSITKKIPISSEEVVGAIVMNCNPFTKGHRYLVEYATTKVDRLYIFVVEEDKSFFKFSERYEMVKAGTSDLKSVYVVPSGNFIISTVTFPEYFLKEYVKEKNFDVSQDLETFCTLIAKPLKISVRFAGEEPFDPVTKNYNENMERILPQYGMSFVEIPRLQIEGTSEKINATKVRELLKEKNTEELRRYVPESTMKILLERYID